PRAIEVVAGPRTKAVIPVSIYGVQPHLDEIQLAARRANLMCLEDNAQCFLGRYKGAMVGSSSDAASFSFQSSKHMTSGEGGMITTNDEILADRIRRFGSLGYVLTKGADGRITKDLIQDPAYQRHASVGFNYRMPELCAAVALGQLERLAKLVQVRRRAAKAF